MSKRQELPFTSPHSDPPSSMFLSSLIGSYHPPHSIYCATYVSDVRCWWITQQTKVDDLDNLQLQHETLCSMAKNASGGNREIEKNEWRHSHICFCPRTI